MSLEVVLEANMLCTILLGPYCIYLYKKISDQKYSILQQ